MIIFVLVMSLVQYYSQCLVQILYFPIVNISNNTVEQKSKVFQTFPASIDKVEGCYTMYINDMCFQSVQYICSLVERHLRYNILPLAYFQYVLVV